jgi:hypothetical protein
LILIGKKRDETSGVYKDTSPLAADPLPLLE